ncbi:cupin 2 domain-containing protein [Gammaproteobacteria bacterium]
MYRDNLFTNLLAEMPTHLPEELFQNILVRPNLRIERILSHGHASPEGFWYDQEQHECVVLLQGAARLQIEDGWVDLKLFDFLNIPAHQRHRVEWTTPEESTIWLAIYYGDCL